MSHKAMSLAELQRRARAHPAQSERWIELAVQAFSERAYAEAAEAFVTALRMNTSDANLWSNYAASLSELGRINDAIGAAREAIRLNPRHIEAWNNLGAVLDRSGRPLEAVGAYEQALAIHPTSDIWSNLGNANKAAGRAGRAIECYRNAVALRPDNWRAWSNMLFVMNYSDQFSLTEIANEHRRYGLALSAGMTCKKMAGTPLRDKLRVGFVSADLYNHPVGRLLLPVLEASRSGQVAWTLYDNNVVRDGLTDRLHGAAGQVRNIAAYDDQTFARQVADDQIDVLIDLSGHTAGNRLTAFARRLAPVQVSWLGYAFTTGVGAIDYVITDPSVLPDEDREYYTETPAYLPDFYCVSDTPDTSLKVSLSPMLRQGYPTFGSFNNPAKISTRVLAVWAKLLQNIPEARLLFKNKAFAEPSLCRTFVGVFVGHGISPCRLSFEGQSGGDAYFESFSRVDVALDPFPFPGLMTTLDTLWMGVPVITLQERGGMLGRHGARLLEMIGHPDWVAKDETAYLQMAAALVANPLGLEAYRSGNRSAIQNSPVMAVSAFASAFETLLLELAERHGMFLARPLEAKP